MTLDEYQKAALRTAGSNLPASQRLAVWGLGVAGEAGEVADMVKKIVGHNHALNPEAIAKELGDTIWYIAVLAAEIGLSLDDVAALNIEKLRKRYPDGFSSERSINRVAE